MITAALILFALFLGVAYYSMEFAREQAQGYLAIILFVLSTTSVGLVVKNEMNNLDQKYPKRHRFHR